MCPGPISVVGTLCIALAVSDMRRRGFERSLLHRDLGELTSIYACRMMQTDHPVGGAARAASVNVPICSGRAYGTSAANISRSGDRIWTAHIIPAIDVSTPRTVAAPSTHGPAPTGMTDSPGPGPDAICGQRRACHGHRSSEADRA